MTITEANAAPRLLTIGAVCQRLKSEFPDISISKIRYLEDQGLLAPRRTQGGGLVGEEDEVGLAELCERAGITPQVARELEEFGLLEGTARNGDRRYGESDVEIAIACARLSHFGVAPRHLRIFRTAADREAALLEQLVAPALRSRHPERRQAGLDDLAALADLTQELSQLLFRRGLRRLAV